MNAPICIECGGRNPDRLAWTYDMFGNEVAWLYGKSTKLERLRVSGTGWFYLAPYYYFANAKDASIFLLRWGGEIVNDG